VSKQALVDTHQKFGFIQGYEAEQLEHLASLLNGADRFVDVGANRGMFAWVANRIGHDLKVFLIEADPKLSKFLESEVRTWPPAGNTLAVISCAAGDRESVLGFHVGIEDTVGTFVESEFASTGIVNVSVKPLDALIPPGPRTVFKIDVEGFEYRVLLGAKGHLKQRDCKVLVEVHGWGDQEISKYPVDVLVLLYRLGYAPSRCGAAHYMFERASFVPRTVNFLRWAPSLFFKSLIRRLGARDAVYKLFGMRKRLSSGLSR
jgi:FkbM family methyltransferase